MLTENEKLKNPKRILFLYRYLVERNLSITEEKELKCNRSWRENSGQEKGGVRRYKKS